MPPPPKLGINGTFAAFRVLEQDVDAFAEFIDEQASANGMSKELIEAKLCARWSNGTPLALSPDSDTLNPPIPSDALNDFDYEGDERGYRCAVGSHIRRMYPRGQRVAGNGGHLHRIVRRGIIYGPPYDPAHPRDGRIAGCSAYSSVSACVISSSSSWLNGPMTAYSPPGSDALRTP
ncbi:MAG: hypothetical protein M3228_08845 [Actinomycetota bacterium]|nr:hypothetical protein [Actinomycetota bacterium]